MLQSHDTSQILFSQIALVFFGKLIPKALGHPFIATQFSIMRAKSLKLLIQERLRAKIVREDGAENGGVQRSVTPSSIYPEIFDSLVFCNSNLTGKILASAVSTEHKQREIAPEIDPILDVSTSSTFYDKVESPDEFEHPKYDKHIFRDNSQLGEGSECGTEVCFMMDSTPVFCHAERIISPPNSVFSFSQPSFPANRPMLTELSADTNLHEEKMGTKRKADAQILLRAVQGSAAVSFCINT